MSNSILTYRQLRRRKEFHKINEIRENLEWADVLENNQDIKPIHHCDCFGNLIKIETGWTKRTHFPDICYLFELLEWARMKRYTL